MYWPIRPSQRAGLDFAHNFSPSCWSLLQGKGKSKRSWLGKVGKGLYKRGSALGRSMGVLSEKLSQESSSHCLCVSITGADFRVRSASSDSCASAPAPSRYSCAVLPVLTDTLWCAGG
jgi:hypothetical protein